MKYNIVFKIVIIFCLSFFQMANAEKIEKYIVDIQINNDATVNITETILYDFEDEMRHGINRDMPYKYQNYNGDMEIKYTVRSVKDEQGNDYQFKQSIAGNNLNLRIGDPNSTISGKKYYIIEYTVKRAINYFQLQDEFYWNAIGANWKVPIDSATVNIKGPEINKTACFQGPYASRTPCNLAVTNGTYSVSLLMLDPYEGITVVAGFPKGIIKEPNQLEKAWDYITSNLIILFPPIILLILILYWFVFGRDPKGKGVIIAQYTSPTNLSPLESSIILTEKADPKMISTELISLAIKGYLNFKIDKKNILIERIKDYDENLSSLQKLIMNRFFPIHKGTADTRLTGADVLNLSSISENPTLAYSLSEISNEAYEKLTNEGYFPEQPNKVRDNFKIIALLVLLPLMITSNILIVSMLIILAIIIAIIGPIMPRKTQKGVETKEYLLGLKKYIELAESRRIEFHNKPEKNPEHFEELLPYAMIFGLEKEWIKYFKGFDYSPSWYHDINGGSMSIFNNNFIDGLSLIRSIISSEVLDHSIKEALSKASDRISSAGSGGSGFGGGGGVGGGFGGGGGGSW